MPLNFSSIISGTTVYLDANTLVYHFSQHATFGPACTDLLERIENKDLNGVTSAGELSDTAQRLMTIEAPVLYGWPHQGMTRRLRNHPDKVQQLSKFRQALVDLDVIGLRRVPITAQLVSQAADISLQTGLLSNDALIVAVMRDQGLTHLASHDTDFDRVPGLTRYGPI